MKRIENCDGADPAGNAREPVVWYVSQERGARMAMSHDRIASHSLEQPCFKKSTSCSVLSTLIAWCMSYGRSWFYMSCDMGCSVFDESHSVLLGVRWASWLWMFYLLKSIGLETLEKTKDGGWKLVLKLGILVGLAKNVQVKMGETTDLLLKMIMILMSRKALDRRHPVSLVIWYRVLVMQVQSNKFILEITYTSSGHDGHLNPKNLIVWFRKRP